MIPTPSPLMTINDILQFLRIGKTSFYENVRHQLPAPIWIGTHPRWRQSDVVRFLDSLSQNQSAA